MTVPWWSARRRGVLAALLCVGAVSASCGGGSEETGPPSAILITLDTTNADALSCFGGPPGVTPHLDALAKDAVRYRQARSVAPLTLPSHASMLTGLYPPRHTVRDNAWRPLPQSATTLAERARQAGYQTGAFLSAVVLSAPYGLDQGFATYDEPRNEATNATAHMSERGAEDTTARALDWLAARDPERPFFLWVHYFEPHAPYAPPQQYLQQARGVAYLGEVARMDASIGRLVEALDDEGLLERSWVTVVADHGEALGRHGEPTHSILCYDDVLRVPMFVRPPNGHASYVPGGRDTDASVSVVDVYPTLFEALALGPAPSNDGRSLLSDEPGPDRPVYFESFAGFLNYGWSPLCGWADATTKFVQGTRPELYRLDADPLESENRFDPAREDELRSKLAQLLAADPLPADEPGSGASLGVDRELVEGARALGYAAAADPAAELPDPLSNTGLPDARDRMDELERFYRATLLRNEGRRAEAIALMREVSGANPNNVYAKNVLATFLLEEGRLREAAAELLSLSPERQQRVNVQDVLGHALEGLGELPRALQHFERALSLKPGDAHQEADVARVKEQLERASASSTPPR